MHISVPLFKVVAVSGDRHSEVDSKGKSTADVSVVKTSAERDRATHHKQGQVFQPQTQKNNAHSSSPFHTFSFLYIYNQKFVDT